MPQPPDPSRFPPFAVTVDIVILTVEQARLMVALVERGEGPYKGDLALPGGFVRIDEDLEAAALRELSEETGLVSPAPYLEQLGAYGAPERDPRMRVVTVGYWAIVPDLPRLRAGTDAASASLLPVDQALGPLSLAFDHQGILTDAVERARSALEATTVATRFCGDEFTISELRGVYESVWGVKLDQGNFQKKVVDIPGFLIPTGETRTGGRGRPPELFTAGPETILDPPIRRPT